MVALLYSPTLQSVKIESAKIKSAKIFYCISWWFRQFLAFWAILVFSHFRFLHFAKCNSKATLLRFGYSLNASFGVYNGKILCMYYHWISSMAALLCIGTPMKTTKKLSENAPGYLKATWSQV